MLLPFEDGIEKESVEMLIRDLGCELVFGRIRFGIKRREIECNPNLRARTFSSQDLDSQTMTAQHIVDRTEILEWIL